MLTGNLALSRAIGDFEFKNNHGLPAENQIVTANPDIEVHELSDEDEFLILACDGPFFISVLKPTKTNAPPTIGIWDCVTSQQCVDMVRRQVAQKKPLQEICEVTIQRCCAPDADTGAGIGCDNMTMIVIALLNGRTLDQWYDWVADRVQQNVGYETPEDLPQVFSESRILAAQHRSQFRNSNSTFGPGGSISLRGPSGFGALARVLGAGGITFNPAPRGGEGVLSFGHDDEDEYEDDDDEEDAGDTGEGGLFGVNRLKFSGSGGEKVGSLRNQLDDLESGLVDDEVELHDGDKDKEKTQVGEDLPRANITLQSPSEKQGMIDLDAVQDQSPTPTAISPLETGFASNGKTWIKVSGPTPLSEVTTIGSPLVPIPPALKDFKAPGKETPPPPAPKKPGEIDEDAIPNQETGRTPDADATATPGVGVGLTNGLLDKSEAVA